MELQGERLIPATVDQTWAALNDPEVLKSCIAGCESVERTADDAFAAVVALKIGPVSARFKGNLKMTNIVPPTGYTINFDGQGGIAGFGKGSADVALAPEDGQTRLKYDARATVGGKMAQMGSRLIDATAAKITEDFFKAFEAHLRASAAQAGADVLADAPVAVEGAAAASSIAPAATFAAAGDESVSPVSPEAAIAASKATAPAPTPAGNADIAKLWWLIGAVVVLAIVYFVIRK